MPRHGRLLLAAAAVTAAFLLAPVTASAAGLIAAYEQYVTGKGFEIRIVNAATGTQISVPAGVNTPDDELHPALSADGGTSSSRACGCCRSSTATSSRRPSGR